MYVQLLRQLSAFSMTVIRRQNGVVQQAKRSMYDPVAIFSNTNSARKFCISKIHPAETFPLVLAIGISMQGIIFAVAQSIGLKTIYVLGCGTIGQFVFPGKLSPLHAKVSPSLTSNSFVSSTIYTAGLWARMRTAIISDRTLQSERNIRCNSLPWCHHSHDTRDLASNTHKSRKRPMFRIASVVCV